MIALAKEAKTFISADDYPGLLDFYSRIKDNQINWEYIFKECYIHACLKKKKEIVLLLKDIYESFDPVAKVGLKHVLIYGKYLLGE